MIGSGNPEGVGFHPSNKQVLSYLEQKNQGKDSQVMDIMPVIPACKHEPPELPGLVLTRGKFREREWFTMPDDPLDMEWHFFSPLDFISSKSTRVIRKTQQGFWKKQGKDRIIRARGSKAEIGRKRTLTFYQRLGETKPKKTDWVIHEYFLTVKGKQIGKYVLCRLKNKSDKSDDEQHAPICDEPEPASGSCSMTSHVEIQAAANGMITEAAEENQLASKELGNVSNGNDDEAETCSGSYHFTPSALEIQAATNGMITTAEELLAYKELGDAVQNPNGNEDAFSDWQTGSCRIDKLLYSHFPQPHQLPQPHPPQVHCPSTLQSPISTALLGNVSHGTNVHDDECRKRKYPFGDNDPSLMKKKHISINDDDELVSNTASNSDNQATDGNPEGDSVIYLMKNKSDKKDSSICDEGQPSSSRVISNCENQAADDMIQEAQENGESLLHPPPPLDDCCSLALQSPISLELEDVLQANGTNDDCNDLQSLFRDDDSCIHDKNEYEKVYDMLLKLCDLPDVNQDPLFRSFQQQDYTSRNLKNVSQANVYNGDCNNWQSACTKNISTNEIGIPVGHTTSNFENQATYYRTLELCDLPDVNQNPLFRSFQQQDYTSRNLENVPQADIYNGDCNNWQSACTRNISTNEIGIPVGHTTSNFENQATDYRTLEVKMLCDLPDVNQDPLFRSFQQQDYTSRNLKNVPQADVYNGDCNNWQSACTRNISTNEIGIPVGHTTSNFENQATYYRTLELCDLPDVNQDPLFRSFQQQDYTSRNLKNVSQANVYNGDCNNWQSACTKNISTNEIGIPVGHTTSNFENQATYYRTLELCDLPDVNQNPLFRSFQQQDYTSRNLKNVPQANVYNGDCNNWQSACTRNISTNEIGIPVGHTTSNFENQATDYRTLELCDLPDVNQNLLFRSFQQQDYTSRNLENVPQANVYNGDCNNWQSACTRNISTKEIGIPVGHTTSNFENQATDYRTLELCDLPDVNQDPLFRSFQQQDYTSRNLKNVPQANVYNGDCNNWQSACTRNISTNEIGIPVGHTTSNFENQATDYRTLELCDLPDVNQNPLFRSFQQQDYTSRNLENVPQANVYNGDCNNWQSACTRNISTNEIGIPVGHTTSNFENQATYYRTLELCDLPDVNQNLLFRSFQQQDYTSRNLENAPQANVYNGDCNNWQSACTRNISTKEIGIPVGHTTSNFENEAIDYRTLELCDLPNVNQDPLFRSFQQQDYTSRNLENVPQANVYNGDCNNWQSACTRNISTNEIGIPVGHTTSNFENQATDYRTLEVHPQTEGNLESSFYSFLSQDSTLQPLIDVQNTGDALHNIECNELQSRLGDHKFLEYKFVDEDYYSLKQQHQLTPTCQTHWEGSIMGIVE